MKRSDGLLNAQRIVQSVGLITLVFEKPLHEFHLRRGVVDDQYLFAHDAFLRSSPRTRNARRQPCLLLVEDLLRWSKITVDSITYALVWKSHLRVETGPRASSVSA
jgi:hypothetical protein